ncbi:MAG: hypothetical protein ACJ8DC_00925 [Gemmatimonadales bacterium]
MAWTGWLAVAGLGAVHGVNPGMGWLFAVALGLQEGRARAVWRALSPLAVGHALAIGAAVLVALALGRVVPAEALRWIVAGALVTLGGARLLRHRHPRYGGMQVSLRELTAWSFLMASAHGAGLMLLPLLVGATGGAARPHSTHLMAASLVPGLPVPGPVALGLQVTALHTAGYLLVTGLIALLVYWKLGLRMLRTMWINLDLIWGGALVVTGAVAVLA